MDELLVVAATIAGFFMVVRVRPHGGRRVSIAKACLLAGVIAVGTFFASWAAGDIAMLLEPPSKPTVAWAYIIGFSLGPAIIIAAILAVVGNLMLDRQTGLQRG